MEFFNKIALVMDAGEGIGQGVAIHLAESGADVVVHYSGNESRPLDLVEYIHSLGRKAMAIQADVAGMEDIKALIHKIKDSFGSIDILVNNCTIDHNSLKSSDFYAQECARELMMHGSGKIVNIHWDSEKTTFKTEMNAFTSNLANRLAPYNIQVNTIGLHSNETDIKVYNESAAASTGGKPISPYKIGYPEDIAKVVAFFASSDADFVSGQVLNFESGVRC